MLAHGFTTACRGGKFEVARLRITEAGRNALSEANR